MSRPTTLMADFFKAGKTLGSGCSSGQVAPVGFDQPIFNHWFTQIIDLCHHPLLIECDRKPFPS
ncbi:MAG: hypothetical protein QNJ64_14970 [Crocosphaera sp.]|nr:hypothetical protein [Crocosphaera sp.]